jgi:hypothetical protein
MTWCLVKPGDNFTFYIIMIEKEEEGKW